MPVPVPVPLCAVTRARMLTRVAKRMKGAIAMVNCFSCRKGLEIDSGEELMIGGVRCAVLKEGESFRRARIGKEGICRRKHTYTSCRCR